MSTPQIEDINNDAVASLNASSSLASSSTTHTDYGLSRTRQTSNLKRDANIQNFTVEPSDYDKNINIVCNSGFFIEVASPLLLDLAKQATIPLTINNVSVMCSMSKKHSELAMSTAHC